MLFHLFYFTKRTFHSIAFYIRLFYVSILRVRLLFDNYKLKPLQSSFLLWRGLLTASFLVRSYVEQIRKKRFFYENVVKLKSVTLCTAIYFISKELWEPFRYYLWCSKLFDLFFLPKLDLPVPIICYWFLHNYVCSADKTFTVRLAKL